MADEGREEEVVTRLARVGYDNTLGYLKGGFESWKKAGKDVDTIEQISAEDFAALYKGDKNLNVLDVRRNSEYDSEHIERIENFPLDFINKNMSKLDKEKKYFLHCAGGYRSMITSSILRSRGFDQLVDIEGGFEALIKTGLPKSEYHEPTTML